MDLEPVELGPGSGGRSPAPVAVDRYPGKRMFRGELGRSGARNCPITCPLSQPHLGLAPIWDPPLGPSDEQQVTKEQQAEGGDAGARGEEHAPPAAPQLCQLALQLQASRPGDQGQSL